MSNRTAAILRRAALGKDPVEIACDLLCDVNLVIRVIEENSAATQDPVSAPASAGVATALACGGAADPRHPVTPGTATGRPARATLDVSSQNSAGVGALPVPANLLADSSDDASPRDVAAGAGARLQEDLHDPVPAEPPGRCAAAGPAGGGDADRGALPRLAPVAVPAEGATADHDAADRLPRRSGRRSGSDDRHATPGSRGERSPRSAPRATSVPMVDLEPDGCRWPVAEDGRRHLFCNIPVTEGQPYCAGHAPRAISNIPRARL